MQKSINEKSYFFHLGRSIKIVFSADRSHKCDHRQISQASVPFPEKHHPSRRCGGWGGRGGGKSQSFSPEALVNYLFSVSPVSLWTPAKAFFPQGEMQRCLAAGAFHLYTEVAPRGILSCTGVWPLSSSLVKVTAWRSRYLLPEMKPWMKTKRFGY